MKHARSKVLLLWAALLAQLLAATVPAEGFVVCLEADGRVGVEFQGACAEGGCAEGEAAPAQTQPCACIDLALRPADERVPEGESKAQAPAPQDAIALPLGSGPEAPARGAGEARPVGEQTPRPPPGRRQLESIVLRN